MRPGSSKLDVHFASPSPVLSPWEPVSPALEATLERGAPKDNSGELVVYL